MLSPINLAERYEHELHFPMTAEEFLAWDEEHVHAEWVNGEVTIFMPASPLHQAISNFLETLLTIYVNLFKLGIVRSAPLSMRARPGGSIREPDLVFISREHLDWMTPRYLDGSADLVIEIISPTSTGRDRADKFYEYEEAGIREYLIVDPRAGKQRVDYYVLDENGSYQPVLANGQGRYLSRIIDGFWFRKEWLLGETPPDPLRALMEIAPDAVRKTIEDSTPEGS